MKKLAAIATGVLSLGYLGAFEMPQFGLDVGTKFSSEYITRGHKEGCHVFIPNAEVSVPMFDKAKVYGGIWSVLGTEGDLEEARNQLAPYIGASYDITDMFTLDVGYIHHFYTNTPTNVAGVPSELKRNSSEIYFGVMADVLLSPSLYFYYDFDAKEIAIEGKVAYSFDFAQFGVTGVSLDLTAKLGYDRADKPFCCSEKIDDHKDVVYYGIGADLVYGFNEHTKARVGIAFEGNSGNKEECWANEATGHKNFVWFNASVDCSF